MLKEYNDVSSYHNTGVKDMQMIVPDFWKGRGRYSKSAIARKIKDETPFQPVDKQAEAAGVK